MKAYGVDLSRHNGTVDFDKLKEDGNSFVILRAGYGTEVKDSKLEEYYKKAKERDLHVGAYWYSYALTEKDAEKEVEKFLETVKGKQFDYPLFLDMEDADGYKKRNGMPSNNTLVAICKKFCSVLESNGYYAGIYASESWFNNQLKELNNDRYDRWLANWGNGDGILQDKERKEAYKLHQYTSSYMLNGKRFDRNIVYNYDYPTTIKNKGLNGYPKQSKPNASTSKPTNNTKKYLNLYPSSADRTVYNASLKKVGTIKPHNFGGLSYEILGYANSNRYVRIKTRDFGEVRICVDKKTVGDCFNISTTKKY